MALWYLFVGTLYLAPLALCVGMILKWVAGIIQAFIRYPAKRFGLSLPSMIITTWDKTLGTLWSRANQKVGALEYAVGVPRNYTIGAGYAAYLLYLIVSALLQGEMTPRSASNMVIPSVITFLSVVSHQRFIFASLKIAEFLRTNPDMSPRVFFEWFYQLLGPIPYRLPDPMEQEQVNPVRVDFRTGKPPEQSTKLLVKGLWDTAHLAHICLRNLRYIGPESAREIFDCMASMWGKRILQILNASFQVKGAEKLEKLRGRIVLSLNHKSHMDFVLTFFALSGIRLPSGRRVRPRFVTAKDHFVDNIIVYEFLGVGRLIETVDMVFIDRKKIRKGLDILSQAASFVAEKPIEIAIFPQGTRAVALRDRFGGRQDAGYYTTFSPKGADDDMGHVRKGLAYLAVDAALKLTEREDDIPLHIVNIGIEGTASLAGKGSFTLQTEVPVLFNVGEIIHLTRNEVEGLVKPHGKPTKPEERRYLDRVDEIYRRVDLALIGASRIRENLRERFIADLEESLRYTPERIERVQEGLEEASRSSDEIFKVLDRLYSCPVQHWDPALSQLAQVLIDGSSPEALIRMRRQITLTLMENFKLKQHGRKVRKSVQKKGPG